MRTRLHPAATLFTFALVAAVFAVGNRASAQTNPEPAQLTGAFDCVPSPNGGPTLECTPRATPVPPKEVSLVLVPVAPPPPPPAPVERNRFVEVLGGVVGELVAVVPAVGLGAAIDAGDNNGDEGDGFSSAFMGSVLTYLLLSPFTVAGGVTLFSKADLSYGEALLGAAIGTAPGAVLLLAGLSSMDDQSDDYEAGAAAVALSLSTLIVAPIVSMAFADPVDEGNQDQRDAEAQRARIAPTASVTPDGAGGMVGLTGRF